MQSVSSQPFRRIPLDCMFRNAVQILTVSCPFGAYISIRTALALNLDHAFRIFESDQLGAAVRAVPGEWIPGVFALIHF